MSCICSCDLCKLKQRIKTYLFLGFEFGVNDYWMWFVEPISSNLLISRVIKIDKFFILFEAKELIVVDISRCL